jgi:archaellum component FlaG (FlaF/FlaG flagellin family)
MVGAPLALMPVAAGATTPPPPTILGSPYYNATDFTPDWVQAPNDPTGGADTTNYSVGSKEDDTCPSIQTGTAPNKDDLDTVWVASKSTADAVYAYMAWHRPNVSGTTTIGFELNQSGKPATGCNGANPARTPGDLLFTYDFQGNSPFAIDISVDRWDGSKWVDYKNLPDGSWQASINSDGSFGELVVDLVAAGIMKTTVCQDFGDAFATTRASNSVTSELKDFTALVPVDVTNCGRIDIQKTDDNGHPLDGATFTLSQGDKVVGFCTTGDTAAGAGRCSIADVFYGSYTLDETQVPTGYSKDGQFPKAVNLTADTSPVTIRAVNPRQPVSVAIHKTDDAEPPVPLDGATFTLYTSGADSHPVGGTAPYDGVCTTGSTGSSGNCTLQAIVDPGKYLVVETSTPDGYVTAAPREVDLVPGQSITTPLGFVDNRKPSGIDITKKVNGQHTTGTSPLLVEAGAELHYTVLVKNTGEVPITIESLTDSRYTGFATSCDGKVGDVLDPNETISCAYSAKAADPGASSLLIDNKVSVTATDQFNRSLDAADHAYVRVYSPAVHIEKTADPLAHVGDPIHYRLTVTNPGNVGLDPVSVTDDQCDAAPVLQTTDADGVLSPGETWIYTCSHVVQAGDPDHIVNTADVTGRDPLGTPVSDSASAATDVLRPAIHVTKAAAPAVHVGETIDYTITVENTGNALLQPVHIADDRCDGDLVSLDADGTLSPGETGHYSCTHMATAADDDPLVNTVRVTGTDALGLPVHDSASAQTDILKPAITVSKTATEMVHVGEVIEYAIVVTNSGDAPLSPVEIGDPRCDGELVSEDAGETLQPGQSWHYSCTHVATADDNDPLVNTVRVTGTDELGLPVHDSASAETDILHPAIAVAKSGPTDLHVGDSAAYTIVVTNPGDTPLSSVSVTDAKCDGDPVLVTEDADGILSPGEEWTYECSRVIQAGDAPSVLNTAEARGRDPLEKTVKATADHTVDVLMPAIAVVKTGPANAHVGDAIVYTIVVTNPGNTPLASVKVVDTKCQGPPVLATEDADGLLSPGESWTYHCTYRATAADGASIVNTASASGTDKLGETVNDSDSHSVVLLHPAITIDKTASPDSISGSGSVTYTYLVTNTGDAALSDVLVTDDILGAIGHVGTLAPGQSITMAKTVDVDASTPPTNIGTATGTDVLGETVTANDPATITVVLGEQLTRPEPAPELPRTGAPLAAEIRAALALIEVGVILELSGRRRRRTRRRPG